jgi:hypothetical protein
MKPLVVVATTLHAYVTDQVDTSEAWLYTAENLAASKTADVRFFAALETDARGVAPFKPRPAGRPSRARRHVAGV